MTKKEILALLNAPTPEERAYAQEILDASYSQSEE